MSDEEMLEAIGDKMSLTWGILPDVAMSNFDAWRRNGYTPAQIQDAVQAALDSQVRYPLSKPFGWIGKRLSDAGPSLRRESSGFTRIGQVSPPVSESIDPDAVPPTMAWVWDAALRRTCSACKMGRMGFRASQILKVAHSCGEWRTYAEAVLKPASDARREEAKLLGECPKCWGAGFIYKYGAREGERVMTVRGDCRIHDGRGVRHLIACRH